MATPTTPTKPAPTKPEAPKNVVTPPTPPAPTAPPAPPAAPKAPSKPRVEWTYYFDTAELAKAEAEKRDGGPRRPFSMTLGDKTIHVVAHNPEHASKLAFEKLGGSTVEIGKETKRPAASAQSVASMLSTFSEADRKMLEEALAALKK